jgi:hypothetical protein
MKAAVTSFAVLVVLFAVSSISAGATPSGSWRVETFGSSGPLIRFDLPNARGKTRTVYVVFEYERRCDPLFLYGEFAGSRLGRPTSQSVLKNSSIGVVLNGYFYTWHAARTAYDNGYEAGFGITNDLVSQLLGDVRSLAYVTPTGETIPLPTTNFRSGFLSALEFCRSR